MNLEIYVNSNGLMSRITQRTKSEAFSAVIIYRKLHDAEGICDHPQHAASGVTADREMDRICSGTLGGS